MSHTEEHKKETVLVQAPVQNNTLIYILLFAMTFIAGFFWGKDVGKKEGGTAPVAMAKAQGADAAAPEAKPTVDIKQIKALFTKENIVLGNPSAKLLFVDVSDPSCPFCHVGAGANKELSAQMSGGRFKYDTDGGTYIPPVREMKKLVDAGKAAYVNIYSNGHGNGEQGVQALNCANEKGKYWEAHELLYSNAGYTLINETVKNDVNKAPELAAFLANAVDVNFMTDCLKSGKYANKVQTDQALASSLGVSGTPGFFVNEKNFAGAFSFKDMQADVDAALK
jgi:protein-disulfide isomerase